jgi:hypothetical protein
VSTLAERLRKLGDVYAYGPTAEAIPVVVPWPEVCAVVDAAENLANGFELRSPQAELQDELSVLAIALDEAGL